MTIEFVVKGKGLADDWIGRELVNDTEALGYTDIRLKSDNENASKLLLDRVKEFGDLKGGKVTMIDPAIEGRPQTNGVVEKAGRDLTTQVRKYKIALETRLRQPIPTRSIILRSLVQHAADTINRTCVSLSHHGKVPDPRLHNSTPKPIDVEFGEKAWAEVPTYVKSKKRSLEERSVSSTWLGLCQKTSQNSWQSVQTRSCVFGPVKEGLRPRGALHTSLAHCNPHHKNGTPLGKAPQRVSQSTLRTLTLASRSALNFLTFRASRQGPHAGRASYNKLQNLPANLDWRVWHSTH